MSFWSSQRLEQNLDKLLNTADPEMIDCNAITLRVGSEIYITPGLEHPNSNSHTKKILSADEAFAIPPGQFAFLVTEEVVSIPASTMGFISIKATFKLKGLVNVSGFHVDPGWNGQLIFSLFNAGPAPVHLQRGLPLFLLWIADLDDASTKRKSKPGPSGIPPIMINNITGAVGSIDALEKRMRDQFKELSDKDNELSNRMHTMDKLQNRLLLGLGILGIVLATASGVAVRSAIYSLFDKTETKSVAGATIDSKAPEVAPTEHP